MVMFLSAKTVAIVLKIGRTLIACAPAVMSLHGYLENKKAQKCSKDRW